MSCENPVSRVLSFGLASVMILLLVLVLIRLPPLVYNLRFRVGCSASPDGTEREQLPRLMLLMFFGEDGSRAMALDVNVNDCVAETNLIFLVSLWAIARVPIWFVGRFSAVRGSR